MAASQESSSLERRSSSKIWARTLALVCALVVVLLSPARAVTVDAAYQNLTYTATGSVPSVGYWQLVATDNAFQAKDSTAGGYNARAVSAETDMVLRVSNTISNLNTSWSNPYYVQFRQVVRFSFYPGVDLTQTSANDYRKLLQYEPQFELIDSFQQGYLLEEVRISDTNVVESNGANGVLAGWNVTMTINYTYLQGANSGNPTPITDFKLRVKQSFIVEGGGSNGTIGNNAVIGHKPSANVNSVSATYGRQRDVSDYQPFVKQNADNLQAIADGIVSNTVAADVIEEANNNFVAAAGSLEAGQAELEGAADASLEAVDYDKINMLGTYSQSISFWGRIINALPTVTGAFWEVLVFGFLIAFLVFILRLVR